MAQVNELSLYFDAPVSLALLRVANYSKTPARGVQEFELLADDLLVYRGTLRQAEAGGGGWQSIFFTDDQQTLAQEAPVAVGEARGTEVLLVNDGQVVNPGGQLPDRSAESGERPATSSGRPPTSVVPYQ